MMARTLFCQFSCPLKLSEVDLYKLFAQSFPTIKFENIFVTSDESAVTWISDGESAAELVMNGA